MSAPRILLRKLVTVLSHPVESFRRAVHYSQRARRYLARRRLALQAGKSGWLPLEAGESVRILFIFQNAELWPTWRTVWECASGRDDVTARLVLMPSAHKLGGASVYARARQFLIENDVPFSIADSFSIEKFAPHVVVLQTPYEELLSPFTSLDALRVLGARIAYIPYGLDVGGGADNLRYQYDLRVQRLAWRIYARSPRHRRMFSRYCRSGSGHVVVTGHPKMDLDASKADVAPRTDVTGAARGRKIVLWTPHFSVEGNAWSTFLVFGESILRWFELNPQLFLLIRPHPYFMSAMRKSGKWDDGGEGVFRRRVAASGSMMIDDEADYRGSLRVADALMADAGSFLLEFLPARKPIAYLCHPEGLGLSEEGSITEHYFTVRSEADVGNFLAGVARGEDPGLERRVSLIDEYLGRLDGRAGERIVNDLVCGVRKGETVAVSETVRTSEMARSMRYWLKARSTYLASPEYYDRQERELEELSKRLSPARRFLDIGCGDGRFTRVLARTSASTLGIDISPKLISQARAASRPDAAGGVVIDWLVQDANAALPAGPFDRMACMGVTSALPSDIDFERLVDDMSVRLSPGGVLIMKDSLAIAVDRVVTGSGQYVARYRSVASYFEVFGRRGFRERSRVTLLEDRERDLVNYLVVFEKVTAPQGVAS